VLIYYSVYRFQNLIYIIDCTLCMFSMMHICSDSLFVCVSMWVNKVYARSRSALLCMYALNFVSMNKLTVQSGEAINACMDSSCMRMGEYRYKESNVVRPCMCVRIFVHK